MEQLMEHIKQKIEHLMKEIDPADPLHEPGYTVNGKYTDKSRYANFYSPLHWTHSFYLGMVAHLYHVYGDEQYKDYLFRAKDVYWNYLNQPGHMVAHDAGFLYSLYAVALYKLTGERQMREMALRAADEVGKRYQFKPCCIDAFGNVYGENHENENVLMIVDDMMNMCLLMWAYGETKHSFYKQVFQNHIETAVNYLIRDDFSIRHACYFDNRTGKFLCEANYCGYSVGSHWARGTAWMIFGLVQALRFTQEQERYLSPLIGVCEKYLSCLQKESLIPNWDFRIPKNQPAMPDTSAAAVVGCAFQILKEMDLENPFLQKYAALADNMLNDLLRYLAPAESENILDKAQSGQNSAGCLWGDYFFFELYLRKNGTCLDFWI